MNIVVEPELQDIIIQPKEKEISCRICNKPHSNEFPLYKRCRCSTGYMHNDCLVKLILKKRVMRCEICRNDFCDIDVNTNTRIIHGYPCVYVSAICNTLFIIAIWVFYYTSLSKECENTSSDNYTSERCINYEETKNTFYYANIFVTIFISLFGFILCIDMRQSGLIELEYDRVIVIQ
tara:strand:+ start:159 stop:692 length:534 start_codon:yes stop_codon:yes gene_type:complete